MEYRLVKTWSICFATSCYNVFLLYTLAYAFAFALVVGIKIIINIVTMLNMAGCVSRCGVSSFYFLIKSS